VVAFFTLTNMTTYKPNFALVRAPYFVVVTKNDFELAITTLKSRLRCMIQLSVKFEKRL